MHLGLLFAKAVIAHIRFLFFSLFVGVVVFDVVVVIVTDVVVGVIVTDVVVGVIVTDAVVGVIVTYYDVSVVVVVGVGVRACMRVYVGERERDIFVAFCFRIDAERVR